MFGPLVCKPGASRNNKTGSWRMESRPKFLKKDCIACNMCLLICPEACISGQGKNNYDADFDYCKGCGNCAWICPKKDIEMVKEGHNPTGVGLPAPKKEGPNPTGVDLPAPKKEGSKV